MLEIPLADGRFGPAHFPEPEETVVASDEPFVARCLHHCRDLQEQGSWVYGEPLVTLHPLWGKVLRMEFRNQHEYFASSPWTHCLIVWQRPEDIEISGTCLASRKHLPLHEAQ